MRLAGDLDRVHRRGGEAMIGRSGGVRCWWRRGRAAAWTPEFDRGPDSLRSESRPSSYALPATDNRQRPRGPHRAGGHCDEESLPSASSRLVLGRYRPIFQAVAARARRRRRPSAFDLPRRVLASPMSLKAASLVLPIRVACTPATEKCVRTVVHRGARRGLLSPRASVGAPTGTTQMADHV